MTTRFNAGRARPVGHARRTRSVKRRSAGLTPARAGALLAMLIAGLGIYGASASAAFGFRHLDVSGARFTGKDAVAATLAIPPGANLFTLATAPLRQRLTGLPTVRDAHISIGLPDTLAVELTERTPILAWQLGTRRLLVDDDGQVFAELDDSGAATDPTVAAAVDGLPVVIDERTSAPALAVGGRIDPIEFDVATRLGSLTPAKIGSAATGLTVAVTDADGFVVRSVPDSWTAVFGFYSPTLRTPELVPGQVRLLASLLAGREPQIARVVLSSDTDGAFTAKPTPKPTTKPGATPKP